MTNPLQMIFQAMQGGMNPQQAIGQVIQQNPQVQQAMQLLGGKSQSQQLQMLRDMAAQRGTTLEQIAQQIGIPLK